MGESHKSVRDAFISYASEDLDTVAKPLAELLSSLGVSVWFDQFDLKIGDSLRRKIDEGLAGCKYGVVILSPSFFGKHYTNRELDGLAQREVDGNKVILPVWVGVDEKQVRQFSPPLADRKAGHWKDGILSVTAKLIEVIRPDILESWSQRISALPRLTTGRQAVDISIGSHFAYTYNDDTDDESEIELIGGFLQSLRDLADIWGDIDRTSQMLYARNIADMFDELKAIGWSVYGKQMSGKKKFAGVNDQWTWTEIAVVRGEPERVFFVDGQFIVL